MNREIIFEAQVIDSKEWVYGSYVCTQDIHRIVYEDNEGRYCEEIIDKDTLSQYAGIIDLDHFYVYENDIVEVRESGFKCDVTRRGVVRFKNGSFYIDCGTVDLYRWTNYTIKRLGSIFTEPELLEDAN